MSLLDGDIADIVAGATEFLTLDFTLRRYPGRSYDKATGKTTKWDAEDLACKGFLDTKKARDADGIIRTSVDIVLIANTIKDSDGALVKPAPGDIVIDNDGVQYRIPEEGATIDRDPASATWTIGGAKR